MSTRQPSATVEVYIVPHGFQMTTTVPGERTVTECHDFAGDYSVDLLRTMFVALLHTRWFRQRWEAETEKGR